MKTRGGEQKGRDSGPEVHSGLDPLVLRAREGDVQAFGALFTENVGWVHALLSRLLGPRGDIEDLIQEVFLRAYRSLPTFRGQSRFSSWLRRIAARVAFDEMRAARTRPRLHLVEASPEGICEPAMEEREAAQALLRIVRTLPPNNRVVLMLHDVEGYTLEEIRLVVGVRSLGTVKSRLRLARREVRRKAAANPALRWLFDEQETEGGS